MDASMKNLPIRKELFWDVDLSRFDPDKNAGLVIERVFNFGTLEELYALFAYYGLGRIKKEIIYAGYLDKKTLNFASLIFGIPKDDFRCYKKKQSGKVHWT